MANTSRLFKGVTSQDVVTLDMDEDDDTTLNITFQSPDRHNKFSLRLLDLPERVHDLLAKTFTSVVSLAATDLQKLIGNMASVADTVSISSVPEGIRLHAYGNFVEQVTTLMERDQSHVVIKQGETAHGDFGTYNLKNLSIFIKASCVASTVDVHLKPDLMVLSYSVATLCRLVFLMGPIAEV
jgi:hypothetical protein